MSMHPWNNTFVHIRSYTCTCAHICLQHVHAHICLCTMCMYMYLYAIINLSARIITRRYSHTQIYIYIYWCYILLYIWNGICVCVLICIIYVFGIHSKILHTCDPVISSRSMEVAHRWAMGSRNWLPSGYVKIAIENGHLNSGFSHEKWWIFP